MSIVRISDSIDRVIILHCIVQPMTKQLWILNSVYTSEFRQEIKGTSVASKGEETFNPHDVISLVLYVLVLGG